MHETKVPDRLRLKDLDWNCAPLDSYNPTFPISTLSCLIKGGTVVTKRILALQGKVPLFPPMAETTDLNCALDYRPSHYTTIRPDWPPCSSAGCLNAGCAEGRSPFAGSLRVRGIPQI